MFAVFVVVVREFLVVLGGDGGKFVFVAGEVVLFRFRRFGIFVVVASC